MSTAISISPSDLEKFCRTNHIKKLSFFGSVLRDDFRPDSDVDVLVEFEPDAVVGFFEMYEMEQELSRLLGGRSVDLHTPNSLSQYIRDQVLEEAEPQYDQA